jgi:hypothetical protein
MKRYLTYIFEEGSIIRFLIRLALPISIPLIVTVLTWEFDLKLFLTLFVGISAFAWVFVDNKNLEL